MSVEGAIDRGQAEKPTDEDSGNIYTNKAEYFELAMLDPTDGYEAAGTMGWLKRRAGSTEYEFQTSFPGSGTALAASSDFYASDGKPKTKCAFSIDNNGYLTIATATKTSLVLGIRPVSSAQALPGDDLLLQFSLTLKITGKVANTGSVRDSDYLAVYDKKMLWRANLYLDEGADDWNNLHPWNAPPAEDAMVAGSSNPVWGRSVTTTTASWDEARWGYNEWNREFSITEPFQGDATVGLANLKAGDGKQVVKLPSFTPVRTLKDGVGSVTAKNVIGGTVAYSYPAHGYEVTAGWTTPKLRKQGKRDASEPAWDDSTTGDPGSMDSPFDFVWKMRQQKADIGDGAVQGLAPGNAWWNYVVTKPTGDMGNDLNPGDVRYVPSLGLYLSVPWHQLNEGYVEGQLNSATQDSSDDPDLWRVQTEPLPKTLSDGTTIDILYLDGGDEHQQRRNASWIVEAGTDCIGFAQRAASYSGRLYAWIPLPKGLMEDAGEANIYTVMDRYHYNTVPIGYRVYPIDERSTTYGDTVVSRTVMSGTPLVISNADQPSIEALRRIIPGDIFVKDSTSESGLVMNDHIAIVASVPDDPYSITDPIVYMSQIILIEGEFTNKIQSVIKKLSVGMYNSNTIDEGIQMYGDAFETPGDEDAIKLNCQSWAIRRLK